MSPKLPVITGKELIKRLQKIGFSIDHQSGSHVVLYHAITKRRAVIPVHTKDLPKGTLRAIIREAGLEVTDIL